ncbi:MAG: antibiotic biosynthesis monooxygenase [Chitinophagales bacterium]|nr:antibiotic biosynthesis monooxygenase [Chitinophagales bacterium]
MTPLLRIVRLSFIPDKTELFVEIFKTSQPLIAAFDGCLGVEIKVDATAPDVYYTVSRWRSIDDLEKYRHSELFQTTWSKTKILFKEKAMAFSLMDVLEY